MQKKSIVIITVAIILIIILALIIESLINQWKYRRIEESLRLSSKSCDELEELISQEFNKIISCEEDTDCILYKRFQSCGKCLNKNIDIKVYYAIEETLYDAGCRERGGPVSMCTLITGCNCVDNKCEEIY